MNYNIWKKLYVMIHYYRYLLVKKKVFNYSELYFSEVTSHKIHTSAWWNLFVKSAPLIFHHNKKVITKSPSDIFPTVFSSLTYWLWINITISIWSMISDFVSGIANLGIDWIPPNHCCMSRYHQCRCLYCYSQYHFHMVIVLKEKNIFYQLIPTSGTLVDDSHRAELSVN